MNVKIEQELNFVVDKDRRLFLAAQEAKKATDADVGNNNIVYFRILSNNVPYVVDGDSGVVTMAGVFAGLSGTMHNVEVEALNFDNFGIPPTNRRTGIVTVRIYKLTDQVIITFKTEKDLVERKLGRIQSVLEQVTDGDVTITEVRVEQTEDGSVDTTGTDVLFFTVQPVNNEVISPHTVIRLIDAQYTVVEDVFTDCNVQKIAVFVPDLAVAREIPYWVWIILGALGLIIICLCCCFLIGCVIERRRNRRWRKQSTLHKSNTSELEQFSLYNYQKQNPAYISPNVDWPDLTTSEVTSVSTIDQPNPLYSSQEIELDMPPEETDVDMPPEETDVETTSRVSGLSSESQEFRMEMYYDDASLEGPGDSSSTENLVGPSRKRTSTPYGKGSRYSDYGTDEDMLARAIQDTDEDDDQESRTSYI